MQDQKTKLRTFPIYVTDSDWHTLMEALDIAKENLQYNELDDATLETAEEEITNARKALEGPQ